MEPVGAFLDEEFDFLRMLTNVDDEDFLLSDNPTESLSQDFVLSPQAFHPEAQHFSIQSFLSDTHNIKSYVSQESSNSSGSEIQGYFQRYEDNQDNNFNNCVSLTNDTNTPDESMNFLEMDNQNGTLFVSSLFDNVENSTSSDSQEHLKRKFDETNETSLVVPPKKKSRVSRNENKRKNGGQRKNKNIVQDNVSITDENKNESSENAGKQIQTPSSSMSEDDGEVATSECKDSPIPNSKGKTRAARGNATDPQSLYARKRRERINERLRVLQTLVPNGTKVDISTMLEEAVQYVKFLQHQIQLLSSDDMWMFAPLAFNGIDVGVYQRMFPNL